jgi:uncharacterized membrane protein (DUF373 family)
MSSVVSQDYSLSTSCLMSQEKNAYMEIYQVFILHTYHTYHQTRTLECCCGLVAIIVALVCGYWIQSWHGSYLLNLSHLWGNKGCASDWNLFTLKRTMIKVLGIYIILAGTLTHSTGNLEFWWSLDEALLSIVLLEIYKGMIIWPNDVEATIRCANVMMMC